MTLTRCPNCGAKTLEKVLTMPPFDTYNCTTCGAAIDHLAGYAPTVSV